MSGDEVPRGPVTRGKDPGQPWDSAAAAEAGRRSGVARREKRARRDVVLEQKLLAGKASDAELVEWSELTIGARGLLADTAFLGASVLARRIAQGDVPDRHVHYVATAIEKLTNVGRLESGEPTSFGVSVAANTDDWSRWLDGLRADAEATAPKEA